MTVKSFYVMCDMFMQGSFHEAVLIAGGLNKCTDKKLFGGFLYATFGDDF
jgi:hypothetical protein